MPRPFWLLALPLAMLSHPGFAQDPGGMAGGGMRMYEVNFYLHVKGGGDKDPNRSAMSGAVLRLELVPGAGPKNYILGAADVNRSGRTDYGGWAIHDYFPGPDPAVSSVKLAATLWYCDKDGHPQTLSYNDADVPVGGTFNDEQWLPAGSTGVCMPKNGTTMGGGTMPPPH